ncbi:hypothetical protein Q7P37_011566 [Cladosporium fusiforme]
MLASSNLIAPKISSDNLPPTTLTPTPPQPNTMAPKKNVSTTPSPAAVPPQAAKPTTAVPSAAGQPTKPGNKPSTTSSNTARNTQDLQQIGLGVWNGYVDKTPQRVKLLDAFLVFLMAVGLLQFLYCVIAGNFPFNAFLSGFSATVGQFVLTVSLRIQTNPENKADFASISHERYVLLHSHIRIVYRGSSTTARQLGKADSQWQGIRGLHLRQHDITLLLRQLHQLERKKKGPPVVGVRTPEDKICREGTNGTGPNVYFEMASERASERANKDQKVYYHEFEFPTNLLGFHDFRYHVMSWYGRESGTRFPLPYHQTISADTVCQTRCNATKEKM